MLKWRPQRIGQFTESKWKLHEAPPARERRLEAAGEKVVAAAVGPQSQSLSQSEEGHNLLLLQGVLYMMLAQPHSAGLRVQGHVGTAADVQETVQETVGDRLDRVLWFLQPRGRGW